jgi:predicted RNA-binding protein associated with RNAse of E/G family
MLLVMSPAIERSTGRAVLLIYMWIPLYMVHQYEEYVLGDFLAWIHRAMPRNAAFLTVRKVLMINLGFV